MSSSVPVYQVTMDDVLQFEMELETETLTRIVVELRTYHDGYKWRYRVDAKAWWRGEDTDSNPLCTAGATYPSRHSPTFPGACLNALMQLHDLIDAQRALKSLPRTGE